MVSEEIAIWRALASREIAGSSRTVQRRSSGLGATTTSQHYFELMSEITQLQAALHEACDLIKEMERKQKRLDWYENLQGDANDADFKWMVTHE